MNSICLLPYCPFPIDSGAKAVFKKHLDFLRNNGRCTVVSARNKPVGAGWKSEDKKYLEQKGISLSLRPQFIMNPGIIAGLVYAGLLKSFKLERAFGHSNPYHRYAFPKDWWFEQTKGFDLAEIHYSYWARLPCHCPKVIVLHDLWSEIMWEGTKREIKELLSADLIVCVSYDNMRKLLSKGLKKIIWSPPLVQEMYHQDSNKIGIVGSNNRFNIEGLRWLNRDAGKLNEFKVYCYGGLWANHFDFKYLIPMGSYESSSMPYESCGVFLVTTAGGTGIQIKAIEAMAHGRAIIARNGAMRGLPKDEAGWINVNDPEEMIDIAKELSSNSAKRKQWQEAARSYYRKWLSSDKILKELRNHYFSLVN
jgi:glycosyltransferase involved in cell wall biosynthesis